MTHFVSVSRSSRSLFLAVGACLLCCAGAACSGDVNVGQAKPNPNPEGSDTSSPPAATATPSTPQATAPDCSTEHAALSQSHTNWLSLQNSFGALAPGVFVGNLPSGDPLTLTIAGDQSASLLVGSAAAAPKSDEGYLCGGPHPTSGLTLDFCQTSALATGGTYPIHGASFTGDHLLVPLQPFAPYDAWCGQQRAYRFGADDCFYDIAQNDSIAWGEMGCTVGSRQVDCGWFQLAQEIHPCACTADSCTAAIAATPSTSLDLRYVAADDKLEGKVLFENDSSASIELLRVNH